MKFITPQLRIACLKFTKRLKLLPIFLPIFSPLKDSLRKARLFMTIEEYAALFITAILFITPILFFIVYIVLHDIFFFSGAISIGLGFLTAFLAGVAIFIYALIYPSYRIDNIKRDIEKNIPYAATHMATIAGTGVPISFMFGLISRFKEYGVIADEFSRIARNIELFGYDPLTAIAEVASQTPSPSLKDLLWGMITIIRSGGDLRQYLMEKAKTYMEAQKAVEAEYIDTLSLMAEVYVALFVAGPIILIIMLIIMGAIGGLPLGVDIIFPLLTYLLMPLLSIAFMIILSSSKPMGAV